MYIKLQIVKYINMSINSETQTFKTQNTISLGGSKFKVLQQNGEIVLLEQYIEDKLVAYEVCKLRLVNKYMSTDKIYKLPTTNKFGMNNIDRTFTKNNYETALNYYYEKTRIPQ